MKKYIASFLTGVLVTVGALTVYAKVESYTLTKYQTPVYIQNVKYPTDALPVLTLNVDGSDNTYVPLRNFSEMMGANVSYNGTQNRIDITAGGASSNTTVNNSGSTTNSNTNSNTNTNDKVSVNSLASTYNNTYKLYVFTYNGVQYVSSEDIEEVYFDDDYKWSNDDFDFYDGNYNTNKTIDLDDNNKPVLTKIPAVRTTDSDDYLITLDYFTKSIYPLIK